MLSRLAGIFAVVVLICGCVSSASGVTWTTTPAFKAASAQPRTIVIISDLHMGLGNNAKVSWYEIEDFRWHKAFKAFLDHISTAGTHQVDLIINGDFLEMWQLPSNIACRGAGPDVGCTPGEMQTVAKRIARAHKDAFAALRKFAQTGENRVHIIPGNHDSSLLIDAVWKPIGKALGANNGRVNFVGSGVWKSGDGRIVIEHGHQIGTEANRYDTWPDIVRTQGGKEYIARPWGERFVQKIFNDQEVNYPIIDNLSPESAGVRYRMADRGAWGTGADVARFVSFNLFQTSLRQKVQILGGEQSSEEKPKWDISKAREQGHRLFVAALPQDDALREEIIADSEQGVKTRQELDMLAVDAKCLPDENVNQLCEQAAIRGNSLLCKASVLGATVEKLLVPREWVLESHLKQRESEYPKMSYLIYGHTHLLEETWQPGSKSHVKVMNSGAFHRVINEEGFLSRIRAKSISPSEGLRRIAVEELPACYTFITIPPGKKPAVSNWAMEEQGANGRSVEPGDALCK